MKTVTLENNEYTLIEEYKDGFDLEALTERYTSYFEDYDYILGDFAYGKLRLKGFCTKFKNYNSICFSSCIYICISRYCHRIITKSFCISTNCNTPRCSRRASTYRRTTLI